MPISAHPYDIEYFCCKTSLSSKDLFGGFGSLSRSCSRLHHLKIAIYASAGKARLNHGLLGRGPNRKIRFGVFGDKYWVAMHHWVEVQVCWSKCLTVLGPHFIFVCGLVKYVPAVDRLVCPDQTVQTARLCSANNYFGSSGRGINSTDLPSVSFREG